MRKAFIAVLAIVLHSQPVIAKMQWIEKTERKSIATRQTENVMALCPGKQKVLSGGFRLSSNAESVEVVGSRPFNDNGWVSFFFNKAHYALVTEMTTWALCTDE